MIFLAILPALLLLYALSTMCRKGHAGLKALQGWGYAHRGLHDADLPENSMGAFRAALENGYGIELDVHLLKDGGLAVIHDASLKRTANADVQIEDLTTEDLCKYSLGNTAETIPTLQQVLDLFAGKAPLIIELKTQQGNHALLAETVCRTLESYKGPYCIESFDPRCIAWLKKNRPHIIRGQLSENFVPKKGKLPFILRFVLTHQMENFLLLPDFIAYKFADRKTLGNTLARKLWGAQGVTWTIKNQQDYDTALAEGWLPIFEGFRP